MKTNWKHIVLLSIALGSGIGVVVAFVHHSNQVQRPDVGAMSDTLMMSMSGDNASCDKCAQEGAGNAMAMRGGMSESSMNMSMNSDRAAGTMQSNTPKASKAGMVSPSMDRDMKPQMGAGEMVADQQMVVPPKM